MTESPSPIQAVDGGQGGRADAWPPWPFSADAPDAIRSDHAAWRPVSLMGVVNVTPDSFSDGGRFRDPEAAVAHGLRLVAEGADVLDIGGESTRPGADPVPLEEELARVIPVIEGLSAATKAPLSIDTMKSEVAIQAARAGATIVNDVSGGLKDPRMIPAVAELRHSQGLDLHLCLMHLQGDPKTMQRDPHYDDPVREIGAHLSGRAQAALDAGIPKSRIVLDPGVGFGKRLPHNLSLLAGLRDLRALGYPILLGASRKSFIGHITGAEAPTDWLAQERKDMPSERLGGTAAAIALAAAHGGADIVRVHDVAIMREAVLVARAISGALAGRC